MSNYKSLIEKGQISAHKLTKSRDNVHRLRSEYLKANTKLEKAGMMLSLEHEKKRMELASLNVKEMQIQANIATENYFAGLAEERKQWSEYDVIRKEVRISMKNVEESRLVFAKGTLEKLVKLEQKYAACIHELVNSAMNSVTNISPKEDISNFEVACAKDVSEIPREEWITYDIWKIQMKELGQDPLSLEDSYIASNVPYEPMQDNVAIIKAKIYAIIPRERKRSADYCISDDSPGLQPSYYEENEYLIQNILLTSEGRSLFCDVLETRKYSSFIEPKNMLSLSSIINLVIDNLDSDIDEDVITLYRLLILSHNFYTLDKRRSYLFKFLTENSKFQDKKVWSRTIELAIDSKIMSENEIFHRTKKRLQTSKKSKDPYYKKFAVKNVEKSSASQVLSQFIFYMINLSADCEMAGHVIRDAARKANLDNEKVSSILSDLFSIKPGFKIAERGYGKSLKKRTEERAI